MLFQETAKHSRHWGKVDQCWGTVVAKHLGSDLGCASGDTQKPLNRGVYKLSCF